MSRSTGLESGGGECYNAALGKEKGAVVRGLTHGVPDVDVALASPVVALREGLPVREHVAFLDVRTLSEAVIVQPGRPVVHVAGMELPVGCSERREEKQTVLMVSFPNMHLYLGFCLF